jgi:hypothetical protein
MAGITGTTGLHQPFPLLAKKGRIFDRPLFAYIDAGATETRSYGAFLFRVPKDYRGVAAITIQNGALTLRERGANARTLSMAVGSLFSE